MSVAGEAKSWFEAIQRVIGLSVEQAFGLVAPAVLAIWSLSELARGDHRGAWPSATPLTWLASVLQATGLHGTWALNTHSWLHDRSTLYVAFLLAAGVLTAFSNLVGDSATGLLGLAAFSYAAALEIQNTVGTLGWYVITSSLPCVFAVVTDLRTDSWRSGFVSHPVTSLVRLLSCIAIVGFSWCIMPMMILLGAVEGYRIKAPPNPMAVPSGAVDLRNSG